MEYAALMIAESRGVADFSAATPKPSKFSNSSDTICEAVLAEVCHLVAKDGIAGGKVIEFVERGRLAPVSLAGELPLIRQLLDQYADAPMDFADGCVVRLAEIHDGATVCTTDQDFKFYRRHGHEPIILLAPFPA